MLEQRLRQLDAAVDDDLTVDLLLELRDRVRDVALEDGGVIPLRLLQRRRDDVLGHVVELVGELAFPRRPRRGEAFVGDTFEQ